MFAGFELVLKAFNCIHGEMTETSINGWLYRIGEACGVTEHLPPKPTHLTEDHFSAIQLEPELVSDLVRHKQSGVTQKALGDLAFLLYRLLPETDADPLQQEEKLTSRRVKRSRRG